jgi:hypothetical protein
MQPGFNPQELQQRLLSEQQLYGLGPNDQPMQTQPMQPGMDFGLSQSSLQPGMQMAQYGGPSIQPIQAQPAVMPVNKPGVSAAQVNQMSKDGSANAYGAKMAAAAAQAAANATPQQNATMPFGSGPNLASNNLMQQVGMK